VLSRIILASVLVVGCSNSPTLIVPPPATDYCAPWQGVLSDTCAELPGNPSGTFGAESRTVCRNDDGTVWTRYGADGWYMRYEPVAPDQWALNKALCDVTPQGVVIRRPE
jgi:hypothetical protein